MRSRLLTVAAVAAFASLSLTACGDDGGPVATSPTSEAAPATSSPTETPPSQTPSEPGTPDPSPGSHVIPDDFPLLDGYPTDDQAEPGRDFGRHGPSRDLEPIRFEACGTRLPLPDVVDELRAGWTNVEDFRERQLSVFASDAKAEQFLAAIENLYAGCQREDTEDGYTSVNELFEGTLGDESVTHVRHYEYDGAAAIGLSTTTIVRVGSWVLVSSTHNEGGGGPDPDREVRDAAAAGTQAVEGFVAAMTDSPARDG